MTRYEQKAWQESIKVLHAPERRKIVPAAVRSRVSSAASAVSTKAAELPGADTARTITEKAFEGSLALTFQPALRSASANATVAKYAKSNPDVTTLEDVRSLPLQTRDAMLPPKFGYTLASAGQGGATAFAVTGAEVATTVSAGATGGVIVAAVAADAVASMAMMGRSVGVVASRYGYDPRLPEEELFAMGVLSVGLASTVGAKNQALAALSRLTQQMTRRATWDKLRQHVMVRVIDKAYTHLGLKLTRQKLAQTVPVLGIGLNAALSAQLTEATFRRAQAVYRLRALSDAYGIDPTEWMRSPEGVDVATDERQEPVVDVMQMLDDELAAEDAIDGRD